MYCKHCGKEFDEKIIPHDETADDAPLHQGYVKCPSCSGQNTRPLIEHNIPPILNFLVKPPIFGSMIIFLLILIFSSVYYVSHKDDMPNSKKYLQGLYDAIQSGDTSTINSYFETGINNDVLRDKCFDLLLADESNLQYSDLEIQTKTENLDTAEVRVKGQMTIMFNSKAREYSFNDLIELYNKDGEWMVNVGALESSNSLCGGF